MLQFYKLLDYIDKACDFHWAWYLIVINSNKIINCIIINVTLITFFQYFQLFQFLIILEFIAHSF